jgi:hypothetical protein
VNRPLIRTGRAKAAEGQIGTFTDAHAGVANQQKSIATQVLRKSALRVTTRFNPCRDSGGLNHRYAVAA